MSLFPVPPILPKTGTAGAPTAGSWATGQLAQDSGGGVWICTAGGAPGTWAQLATGSGDVLSVFTRTGAVVAGNADYLAVASGGLTGATAATRFVGGTASGAPASGTFAVGDLDVDQTGALWVCTVAGTPGTWVKVGGSSAGGLGVYGDGSDGAQTFDGVATILGVAPTGGNTYTQNRDWYFDGATINNGITIIPNGFRIFDAGTLTNNGAIAANGNNGNAGTHGNALGNNNVFGNAGSFTFAPAGGNGSVNNGTAGTAVGNYQTGGNGGHGGAGGTGTAGAGGAGTVIPANAGGIRQSATLLTALIPSAQGLAGLGNFVGAGSGGGGGGGDTTNTGGGGGGGGGIAAVSAKVIAGTGTISANGGNGGNGAAAGNTGGGGGGGGGLVFVISSSVTLGSPNTITGQTITANGGTHGTSNGTGGTGITNGSPGTVILLPN